MNDAEFQRLLSRNCSWWRDAQGWEQDDPDLRRLKESPLHYEPDVLGDIVPDGLYVLRGPRRVGKSVEVKRAIARLIHRGVHPRRIIHFACDTRTADELQQLQRVGRDQATAGIAEPRYWFLDEITAVAGWPTAIKYLRDNTEFGRDCVVLTGSSARDLDDAAKQLAGRRGSAARSDRLLLPMSFRAFCQQFQQPSTLPDAPVIRAADFLGRECDEAVQELLPWLDVLASLWEVYCRCGGLPRAVQGQLEQADVPEPFVRDLFDIANSDALRAGTLNATQSLMLLGAMSKAMSGFMNLSDIARTVGVGDHKMVARNLQDLIGSYLAWPCHQRGAHGLPDLAARSKIYFTDPVLSRLAHLRNPSFPEPDTSVVSEQQIGLHLLRQAAAGSPVQYNDFTAVMCARNKARKEVDFLGPATGALGFEGKYSDTGVIRESATLRSITGKGVFATRAMTNRSNDGDVRYLPAAFVAYLLAP